MPDDSTNRSGNTKRELSVNNISIDSLMLKDLPAANPGEPEVILRPALGQFLVGDQVFQTLGFQMDMLKKMPPTWRLDMVRIAIEAVTQQGRNEEIWESIACGKGCGNCCHLAVRVTDEEAQRLLPYLTPERIKHLEQQKDWKVDEYHLNEESRCAFLNDDNSCGVYEERPLACRGQFSQNSKNCGPDAGVAEAFYLTGIEIAISAYWTVETGHGLLPKQLLDAYAESRNAPTN